MAQLLHLMAATAWFWTFSVGFLGSIIISIALLFCPIIRWIFLLYVAWIWYDRKTSERGGRSIQWVRQLFWWRFVKFYFNHKLITNEDVVLDPKKNYLFASFPHAILPVSPFASWIDGFQATYPNHRTYLTALNLQFWLPFIRELFLSIGTVSVSAPSLKYLLGNENGGNIVSIMIGGADEAKYSKPGKYKIILNKRKGFVKLALQTGCSLVPVIGFGETDVMDQLDFPGLGCIREAAKQTSGICLTIPKGMFLVCPNPVPIVTVVGDPIDVDKVEKPTTEQIEALHQQFVDSIKALFENYKHRYVKDPENVFLEVI